MNKFLTQPINTNLKVFGWQNEDDLKTCLL